MNLLGGDFAADLGGSGMGPMAGGQMGNPLGLPPNRSRKSGSNKTLFIVLGSLAGVGLLVVCGGIGVAVLRPAVRAARLQAAIQAQTDKAVFSWQPGVPRPAAPPVVVWTPDAALTNQLTIEASFDRYSMRLPSGFVLSPTPAPPAPQGGRAQAFLWTRQEGPDGARQIIVAGVLDVKKAPRSKPNELEMALRAAMSQHERGASLTGFSHSAGERGQLAGKQFIRTHFSGWKDGMRIYGIAILTIEGARLVTVFGACGENPDTGGYRLLQAALLTFRER